MTACQRGQEVMKIKVWLVLREGPMPRNGEWYITQVLNSLQLDGQTVKSQLHPNSRGSVSAVGPLSDEAAVLALMHYADEQGLPINAAVDDVGRLSFTDGHGYQGWFVYARSSGPPARTAPAQKRPLSSGKWRRFLATLAGAFGLKKR